MIAQHHAAAARGARTGRLGPHFSGVPCPETEPAELESTAGGSIRVPGLSRAIQVKIASQRGEWEQAFGLLAAKYRARGYEAPSTKLFRFTPYHVLPDTITMVAKHRGRVLATLSLVPDTTLLGLPMESIYGEELASLRTQGRRLAEATSLADTDLSPREFLQVFRTFIKLGMQYHLRQGGDTCVITVNPRHRNFYLKVMGFAPLGPLRTYPTVLDHPAEAYLLDSDLMKSNAPAMYEAALDEALPDEVLTAPDWSPELATYFGSRSTQADRRTIRDIRLQVEQSGSPPRWREGPARDPMVRPFSPTRAPEGPAPGPVAERLAIG